MPEFAVVAVAAVAAVIGVLLGFMARRFVAANAVKHAEQYAQRLVAEARAKQKEIVLEGKDEALHLRRAAEEEAREQRATLQRNERRLLDREEALDRKTAALEEQAERLERPQPRPRGRGRPAERAATATAGRARARLRPDRWPRPARR